MLILSNEKGVFVSNLLCFRLYSFDREAFSPKSPRRQHTTLGKEIAVKKDKISHLKRLWLAGFKTLTERL